MAKDDYFVIVYQVLQYLYGCLKNDQAVNPDLIGSDMFGIAEGYWRYIIRHLLADGYIEGIRQVAVDGNEIVFLNLDKMAITPQGIAYLSENSSFEKVKKFMKDVKSSIPFI